MSLKLKYLFQSNPRRTCVCVWRGRASLRYWCGLEYRIPFHRKNRPRKGPSFLWRTVVIVSLNEWISMNFYCYKNATVTLYCSYFVNQGCSMRVSLGKIFGLRNFNMFLHRVGVPKPKRDPKCLGMFHNTTPKLYLLPVKSVLV